MIIDSLPFRSTGLKINVTIGVKIIFSSKYSGLGVDSYKNSSLRYYENELHVEPLRLLNTVCCGRFFVIKSAWIVWFCRFNPSFNMASIKQAFNEAVERGGSKIQEKNTIERFCGNCIKWKLLNSSAYSFLHFHKEKKCPFCLNAYWFSKKRVWNKCALFWLKVNTIPPSFGFSCSFAKHSKATLSLLEQSKWFFLLNERKKSIGTRWHETALC